MPKPNDAPKQPPETQFEAAANTVTREATRSKDSAREFLKEIGILAPGGGLSTNYK